MRNILVLTLTFAFSLSLTAQNWWKDRIRGEGPTVTKTLNVDKFDGVGLTFSGDVYLRQGNTQSVKVEGQENIINNIVTDVQDGYWKIKFDRPVRNHDPIKVYITVPTLRKAAISGSGDLKSDGGFTNLSNLELGISGSGNIDFDAEAESIIAKISGSGDIDLEGKADEAEVRISGSGDIQAYGLKAQNCEVRISGSGNCQITAEERLDVRVSGSGDVYYKGRPRINSKVSGSGDLISRS